jgi:hypothetical protein
MANWVQLDDEAAQFANDLARVYELIPIVAVALMRGGGTDELSEFLRIRQNLGDTLCSEILNGNERVATHQRILTEKHLPVDWLR